MTLMEKEQPHRSLIGIAISVLSLIVMPLLAKRNEDCLPTQKRRFALGFAADFHLCIPAAFLRCYISLFPA